jgi:hypothetical protein
MSGIATTSVAKLTILNRLMMLGMVIQRPNEARPKRIAKRQRPASKQWYGVRF